MLVLRPRRRRRRRCTALRRRGRFRANTVLNWRCRTRRCGSSSTARISISASLAPGLHATLASQDKVSPGLGLAAARGSSLSDRVLKHLHPTILIRSAVGIEVDNLPVGKTDTESLLNEHVALFFFGKGRLTSSTIASCGFSLGQGGSVVNQLSRLGQVDSGTRLTRCLVVSSQLRSQKLEEATTPVLFNTLAKLLRNYQSKWPELTGQSPPC